MIGRDGMTMMENEVYTIFQKSGPEEEREFCAWFHGSDANGLLLTDRLLEWNALNPSGRVYVVEKEAEVGAWRRILEAFKAITGQSSWYTMYIVMPDHAVDPTSEIAHKIFYGYLWADVKAVNDIMCDVGDRQPKLLLYDQRREMWIFSPANLPRVYWPPESAGQMFFGRNCRLK